MQHTRANDRMSQPDIPLQTPPSSVAPRGVAVPARVRWDTQISSEGSTAPQSPSSVEETHHHAQQTLDREQQQQHASTDRRDAAQAPAQLQQHQHVVTDVRSAVSQPFDAAPLEKRPAAEEASATATPNNHHDDIHLTEPPPRCGLPADLASAGEEQIAAEATSTAATQRISTAPPDTRIPAAETSTISTANTTVIACAANARARRRLRRELGRAPASPYSPFPVLDLGRLISRRHAATAIAAAARRRSARLCVQGVRRMHAQIQAERHERRAAILQRGEEAALGARRRHARGEIRRRLLVEAIELQKLVPPKPMLVMIPDNGADGREMLIDGVHAGGMQGVIRSPRGSRPGDVYAFVSSDLVTALWPMERRIDVASGRGYDLWGFIMEYGGTLEWDASVRMQVALDTAQLTRLPASSELITIGELDTAVLAYACRERQRLAPPGWRGLSMAEHG